MDSGRASMTSPEPAEGLSPNSKAHKKLQKVEKKGGFRKLFGRNKRTSKVPDNAAPDLNQMLASEGRETPEPSPQVNPETPQQATPRPSGQHSVRTPAAQSGRATPATLSNEEPAERMSQEVPHENPDHDEVSCVDTADAEEARDAFSRFDQGPLQEQPAFIPADDSEEEEEEEAIPPPIQRHRSPAPVEPEPEHRLKTKPKFEPQEDSAAPAIARWAQIREAAAKRAAAASQRENGEPQHRPSFGKTEGESDTSGEESKCSCRCGT